MLFKEIEIFIIYFSLLFIKKLIIYLSFIYVFCPPNSSGTTGAASPGSPAPFAGQAATPVSQWRHKPHDEKLRYGTWKFVLTWNCECVQLSQVLM